MTNRDLRPQRDRRLPVPIGSATFDLVLGGIRVRIEDLPTAWTPFVYEQYHPFAEPPNGEAQVVIRCRESSGSVLPLPPRGEMTVLDVTREGPNRYRIRSHWEDGWIDPSRGVGELTLTDRTWDRFSMSVENFLRVAFQLQLIERRAFLLHSAAVLEGDRAFLFFGPSGAGKSTATSLSMPRRALSDDMVLIDASGQEPIAWSVPFYMVYAPEDRARGGWPVRAALRLRQAAENRLDHLSKARAIATLSASVPFVHELGLPHDGLTALVGEFVRSAPVFDLHFTKSDRFWDLLQAL